MNNCDLEKLCVPGVKLEPSFKRGITKYKATVPSGQTQITVDAYPSDNGASCIVLGGEGSKVVTLNVGLNSVVVEVTAEDGTVKKYTLEITKLSASRALLEGIHLSEDLKLVPPFAPNIFVYSCTVPYFQNSIIIEPLVQDNQMKLTVNGCTEFNKLLSITVGDTPIEVLVMSPDGTKSQVYNIIVTREQVPFIVKFMDVQEQMNYECPISLTALYRPVSIKDSDPKHTMSGPYIDLLTRRSKRDPLDEKMLGEDWRVPEYELDMKMSAASVMCCFAYRGCGDVLKLSDLGSHANNCPFKPPTELDPKAVTETEWYKGDSYTDKLSVTCFQHTVQERNWEKRLQQVHDRDTDQLCSHAEENTRFYKQILPKSGDRLDHKDGMSALDALNQSAAAYASAIKLQPKNPRFHFLLAMVLEELYYAAEIYGLRRKNEDKGTDISCAKATGKDEEIHAICKLHNFNGRPSLEQQLKALDMEYHQLKEQGQSSRADYIQNLYAWKSKQAGKVTEMISLNEENPLTQAFLKYKDALSLDQHNWQYNFHVGRHLLLQEQTKEALMFLQKALALQPASAITRCYVGLALLEQDGGPGARTQESVTYLQQGMEKLINDLVTQEGSGLLLVADSLCLFNTQLLSGFVKFGKLLRTLSNHSTPTLISSHQVLHMVADWSAKALCQCPHGGMVTQQLEWTLLEACFGLLELLVEDSSKNEAWIGRRCQALSALIHLTSIPHCKRLSDMQEKVCQLGVISSPCNSSALYLLGTAQLAQYDDRPSSEDAQQALQDAKRSFQASIRLENMPTKGQPPAELESQKWWQEWKAIEEMKKQKQVNQANADKPTASTTAPTRGDPKGRGPPPVSRGANTTVILGPSKRGGLVTQEGNSKTGTPRGSSIKTDPVGGSSSSPDSTSVTSRGRGAPALSKPATATSTKAQAQVNAATTVKAADPLPEKPASKDNPHPGVGVQGQAPDQASANHSSFLHRLGLSRALSRSKESAADAAELYRQVIKMAPEVHDAYTELAELLLKDDPLGAVEIYGQYPQRSVEEQSFDDAFIPGEIVRLLMKCEKYDDPRLPVNMISYGKVVGIGCLEKYINILEEKFKTNILKTVYAGIHNKSEDDQDLQDFFRFKCWI